MNFSAWCHPAHQGQHGLISAARWAGSPQKGGYSAKLPDSDFIGNARGQRDGGLCQTEAPGSRDVPRGMSLWASISLPAQWEHGGEGARAPGSPIQLPQTPQHRAEQGEGWMGAMPRAPGTSPLFCGPALLAPWGWTKAWHTPGAHTMGTGGVTLISDLEQVTAPPPALPSLICKMS